MADRRSPDPETRPPAPPRAPASTNLLPTAEVLARLTPDLLFSFDREGRIVALAPGWEAVLGQPVSAIIGHHFEDHLRPEDRAVTRAAVEASWGDGQVRTHRARVLTADGSRLVQWWGYADRDSNLLHGLARDLTEHERLDQSVRLAGAVFEHALEGIMVTDAEGVIVTVNPAFEDITGYSAAQALGKRPRLLRAGGAEPIRLEDILAELTLEGRWQGEVWNRRRNGELYPQWLSIGIARDANGETTHCVAMFSDVTDLRSSEMRLERLAHYDPLTGLANRTLLYSRIEHAIAVARRNQTHLAVLFLDLDRFKNINDSLGHAVGDELLLALARRVQLRIRAQDTFARLGGDEFVVLMEQLKDPTDASLLAAALAEQLAEPFTLTHGATLYVSASIGIAVFPDNGQHAADLLRNADAAMYHAKAAGRGTYRYYAVALTDAVNRRLELDTRLRGAIERGEFVLHYQAKYDRSGTICGAEALVRWQPPGGALIPPNEFIPVAEETGLIVPLGEWVIEEACKAAQRWRRAGLGDIPVAVNLSAVQLRSRNVVDRLREALARTLLPPELLELEITESAVMEPVHDAILHLDAIRSLGVRLSIDDFGTGYSCLASLKRLPVNVLKIDQSFVRGLPADESDIQIVRTILTMAQNLGLSAIAEGVETAGQFEVLHELGCPNFQGYHFACPEREEVFVARLREAETEAPAAR